MAHHVLRLALWLLVPLALAAAVPAARALTVKEMVLGDPAAPVTMIEYSSLTCPHCAEFHEAVLPGLKERYIDTGKVKLVMRDFPLDELALQASMLAHCAGPERYFGFIEVFFGQQDQWARTADPVAALKQLAQLGGMAPEESEQCLADRALGDSILQARLQGQNQFDISSTPTFVIDGKSYPGSRSVEEFAEVIDPLLE